VIDKIGLGGMGIVYAAYDPELDRRVAIKILRADVGARDAKRGGAWRARMVREAQAMARLAHPNVLPVYDVGTLDDGRVFVAMELVEGGTLSGWLRAGERAWPEIVRMFIAAGRGLAAAHAAGLVHRDFKPDNVLVGRDGRPRVTDFGLVRLVTTTPTPDDGGSAKPNTKPDPEPQPEAEPAAEAEPAPGPVPEPIADSPSGSALLHTPLTVAGTIMGTLGYMSPEQSLARPIDARSDQFSFCAALYEALYRQPAFAGANPQEMMAQVRRGNVRPPPPSSPVPQFIARAVLRGLAANPDARFPSMDALLDALSNDPRRRLRRGLSIAALVTVAVAATAVGARFGAAPRDARCRGADARLRDVWDDARRARLRATFGGPGGPAYAADVAEEAIRVLDNYSARFAAAHYEACAATRLRHEQTEEVLALRMECLESRRRDLRALTDVLLAPDTPDGGDAGSSAITEHAVQAARALPPIDACDDLAALRAAVPPPADAATRARVDALRGRLAEGQALLAAGRYAQAAALVAPLVVECRAVGYGPLVAEAYALDGRLRWNASDWRGAATSLKEAILAAEASRMDDVKAAAAVALAEVSIDVDAGGFTAAREWLRFARAAVARLDHQPERHVDVAIAAATIAFREAKHAEAEAAAREALALAERTLPADHALIIEAWRVLGDVLNYGGKRDEALAAFAHARALVERTVGPRHPDVATLLRKEAEVWAMAHDGARSLERIDAALILYAAALPADALSIAQARTSRAEALSLLGRHAEALVEEQRALPVYERVFGADSLDVGVSNINLGHALLELGRLPEARLRLERGLALYEKHLTRDDADKAEPLLYLGRLALAEGRPRKAIPPLERALALRADDRDPRELLAPIERALAEALAATGDRARAATLAARARAHQQPAE
jgi:tetratricopeptide (TPR) repeat protein